MQNLLNNDEINLQEYLDIMIKRWKMIIAVAIATTILAFVYTSLQKPVYEAKTTVLLRQGIKGGAAAQGSGLAGIIGINMDAGSDLADLAELLKSRAVAAKVVNDLSLTKRIKGWDDPAIKPSDLASAVSGMIKSSKTAGNIMEIKTISNDPQLAADVANGFVQALSYYWNELNYTEAQKKLKYIKAELPRVESDLKYVENKLKLVPRSINGITVGGQGELQRDYEIYSSVYTMLRKEFESTKLDAAKEMLPFSQIDEALKPISPISPKVKTNTIIGSVMGLFAGIVLAFFLEYLEKIKAS